ncbi:MAG: (Fe-S)-binding protein [Hyphomicrobiales bacterium]|nr:(Fe-S)-binding protein [Hyphomicrobiales bacterium]
MTTSLPDQPRIGLFVTCLVDLFRPSIGFAAVKLLEGAGCIVEAPLAQVCCGQPAYNSGDRADAREIARQVIESFDKYDYIVAPSGSCAGMLRKHYPALFEDEPDMAERAAAFALRCYELIAFLTDVLRVSAVHAKFSGSVTYHDSCSSLREMGTAAQPRTLLRTVEGLTLVEADQQDICCGFGGTFSVKYPDISNAMVSAKTAALAETGADLVAGGDLGCLMNIAGKLAREGSSMRVRHIAEILAGELDAPPIASRR